jgi:hypothetical protein
MHRSKGALETPLAALWTEHERLLQRAVTLCQARCNGLPFSAEAHAALQRELWRHWEQIQELRQQMKTQAMIGEEI